MTRTDFYNPSIIKIYNIRIRYPRIIKCKIRIRIREYWKSNIRYTSISYFIIFTIIDLSQSLLFYHIYNNSISITVIFSHSQLFPLIHSNCITFTIIQRIHGYFDIHNCKFFTFTTILSHSQLFYLAISYLLLYNHS